MLWIDGRTSVPQATKRFDDFRVRQYWDSKAETTRAFSSILQINGPAWDVYLLFGRDAEWKEQPPAPAFWMDQLGLENGRPFDANGLAEQIRKSLDSNQRP